MQDYFFYFISLLNIEPLSYHEAIKDKEWQTSIQNEIQSIYDNKT